MKIEAIDLYHVRMPLLEPWRTAYGSDAAIESLLVRMRGEGETGWGESCPLAMPCYSPEYAGGIFHLVRDVLAPRLIGEDVTSGEALQERLSLFKGNPFAKAALDTAWWDLYAKSQGVPLHRALGGQVDEVEAGADFGICDDIDTLLRRVSAAVESGVSRIKLKFAPGWDLPVVTSVREAFPTLRLHIDCNSNYTLSDLPLFRELDALDLAMIEQPLAYDDIADHAELQAQLQTPICLDESVNSLHRVEQALRLKACGYVNIKPGRVGGLTVARQIHDRCAAAGIPCWVGGMLESAVGAMHCAALAALPNFTYPGDLFPSSRFYACDLSEPEVGFQAPWKLALSMHPGIAAAPNPERLSAWAVQRASIRK